MAGGLRPKKIQKKRKPPLWTHYKNDYLFDAADSSRLKDFKVKSADPNHPKERPPLHKLLEKINTRGEKMGRPPITPRELRDFFEIESQKKGKTFALGELVDIDLKRQRAHGREYISDAIHNVYLFANERGKINTSPSKRIQWIEKQVKEILGDGRIMRSHAGKPREAQKAIAYLRIGASFGEVFEVEFEEIKRAFPKNEGQELHPDVIAGLVGNAAVKTKEIIREMTRINRRT